MKVTPAAGRMVRHPINHSLLPPEGREVNDHDLYWARRLRDGDVAQAPPDPPPETTRARKQEA